MKKLLLFIAAAVFAASAAFAQYPVSDDEPVVPDIDPVPDGITIAVYVPEGIDNYRAPLWTGNTNPIPWAGEEMVAVEGAEGWYKVDINATSVQGIPLCQPEGWTEEKGINYWQSAKTRDCRILQSSNISYFNGDFLVVDGTGLVALQVKSWPAVPYEPKRDFTFYVQVPECTPEIQESINIAGSMPGDDGNLWLEGTTFPIVDGVATVTISGFETDEWKVRLTDDWSQQAVECSNGRIWEWNNQVLGEAEGQVIVVEGWGKAGSAIGDCFSDCKPLILSTNNFNLYPGESVKVSLEYKDSPVDATAAVWISNDPEVFTIDEVGLITGVATGQGTFTVTYDGLSATGYVKVLDDDLLDIPVPDIDPVPDGITIAVHIPDGTDCHGAPLWGGDNNDWMGEEMQAIDGYPNWYKLDVPGVSSLQGKPLANFEGWENGLGNWPTQYYDYEVLQESTATYEIDYDGNIVASTDGIKGVIYIDVESWKVDPCIPDREFKFTIVVPECTPEGQETVNIVGSFPDAEGYTWANGIDFPIVDGKAEITITGQEGTEWKVRLTGGTWEDQAVYCGEINEWNDSPVLIYANSTLGEAEGQEIVVEGWGTLGSAIGDCLSDCGTEAVELSPTSAIIVERSTLPITATSDGNDVTAAATWTSSDETVAIVEAGVVTGVAEGNATITCIYNGAIATCNVMVIRGYASDVLLNGSDYYIFQMDETTFNELDQAGKVTSDMRINGVFEGEVLVPEDATRVNYVWNPAAEEADAPQFGVNSFGKAEGWFSIAAASPTPDGCWGNICGGLGIATETDLEVGKLQNLTPDHVLVVVLKGSYTPMESLEISMTPPVGGDQVQLFKVTDATGEYNDGDWEVFTLTYPDLIYMGIDLSQPIATDFWYPWAYVANGAGNRVDVDAVFFYVPGEMSAIDETGASSGKISVSASNGRIYCDEPFRVINLAGQDVTAMNGELQGTYIVVSGDKAVKVVVD